LHFSCSVRQVNYNNLITYLPSRLISGKNHFKHQYNLIGIQNPQDHDSKRIRPIFNLNTNSKVSGGFSGSQEPDHRKKSPGKSPNTTNLSPVESCAPSAQQSTTSDLHLHSDHYRRVSTIISMEVEDDKEDILHFDIRNIKSDISTTCVIVDEVSNQPGPSRRNDTVLDPSKLFFPKVPDRFTLEPTSSLSSTEEMYVKPGICFIKKFQKGVSDVKNSHMFNWIKKSKKSECQEPADPKVKRDDIVSSSPTILPDMSKSCVSVGEPESANSNSVQFFDQQGEKEFITIQIEDEEGQTDESGNKIGKWAINSNVENEIDYGRQGPSRFNKKRKTGTVQEQELPVSIEEKNENVHESDESLKSARNGGFGKVKKNPVLSWIKRYKLSNSPTETDTCYHTDDDDPRNESNGDFLGGPSKESGVVNSQHAPLDISTLSSVQRLVRRLKRKRKFEIEQVTTHPQPNDNTPDHVGGPSPFALNKEDNNTQGPSELCNASGPVTCQPGEQVDVIIEIDSDEENEDNCCMQNLHRCACGAKEKACVMCSFMKRQKKKWDEWNPDLNNPFFMCLAESKLAGLKEAVKPNRGICFR